MIEHRTEHAVSYLSFWYYAWHTELMSMLRSGARLSFMVVTDLHLRRRSRSGTIALGRVQVASVDDAARDGKHRTVIERRHRVSCTGLGHAGRQ